MIKIQRHRNNSWLKESGYTLKEEIIIYDNSLNDILDNTRWYLDNLDYMVEYKVSWNCYTNIDKKGRRRATLPYNIQKKTK